MITKECGGAVEGAEIAKQLQLFNNLVCGCKQAVKTAGLESKTLHRVKKYLKLLGRKVDEILGDHVYSRNLERYGPTHASGSRDLSASLLRMDRGGRSFGTCGIDQRLKEARPSEDPT
ncbi:hypothetical protein AXG93_1923s1860 [Marchantia polymorpha subsp. ruderalis]|nr:hypothetical protein AXG93_1923s1860 [Marchantia polymorpha subsp. ruderalis]